MTAQVIDLKTRRVIRPASPPPNPFAVALAALQGWHATEIYWAQDDFNRGLAKAMKRALEERTFGSQAPCDSEPA